MFQSEWLILMGVGGLFIILGIAGVIQGKIEERGYYESTSHRVDVREYLEHQPERPEPGALGIGGWIAIAIGVVMILVGGGFSIFS